jgi:putative methyltransferase (TIGR04325 family)
MIASLIDSLRRRRSGRIGFTGPYARWSEAAAASTGYAAPDILARARAATAAVRDGAAKGERDTVILPHAEYSFPVIAGLLAAASMSRKGLSVLDFGGALGSSYFQCRPFLDWSRPLRWSVVEQPHFVECGRREFQTDELCFYETVEACVAAEAPEALLLSGVVEYLPEPLSFATRCRELALPVVIVDRTPMLDAGDSRLMVQHVPPQIYSASYPVWFLSRQALLDRFAPGYRLLCDFDSEAERGLAQPGLRFGGFVFVRAR